jgi:hypothetical protein
MERREQRRQAVEEMFEIAQERKKKAEKTLLRSGDIGGVSSVFLWEGGEAAAPGGGAAAEGAPGAREREGGSVSRLDRLLKVPSKRSDILTNLDGVAATSSAASAVAAIPLRYVKPSDSLLKRLGGVRLSSTEEEADSSVAMRDKAGEEKNPTIPPGRPRRRVAAVSHPSSAATLEEIDRVLLQREHEKMMRSALKEKQREIDREQLLRSLTSGNGPTIPLPRVPLPSGSAAPSGGAASGKTSISARKSGMLSSSAASSAAVAAPSSSSLSPGEADAEKEHDILTESSASPRDGPEEEGGEGGERNVEESTQRKKRDSGVSLGDLFSIRSAAIHSSSSYSSAHAT